MSKLYDVISRLEEVSSKGVIGEELPLQKPSIAEPRDKHVWRRVLLLGILFIILGIAMVVGTTWLRKQLSHKQITPSPKITDVASAPPKTVPVEPPLFPTVAPQETTPSSPLTEEQVSSQVHDRQTVHHNEKETEAITRQFEGTMSIDVADDDITVESVEEFLAAGLFDFQELLEEATSTFPRIFIHDLDIAEAIPEIDPQTATPQYTISTPTLANDQKAKTSRWLHQAELYRHQGEWEGAIRLYQRVWDTSQDPAVANNLAAALIELRRPEEAYTILKETILSAPNDPDIKENLRIVEQILAQ